MPVIPKARWFDDPDQILAFARVLLDADALAEPEARSVIDYFEKPWKWDPEHDAWISADRPTDDITHPERWAKFLHELERLQG